MCSAQPLQFNRLLSSDVEMPKGKHTTYDSITITISSNKIKHIE